MLQEQKLNFLALNRLSNSFIDLRRFHGLKMTATNFTNLL